MWDSIGSEDSRGMYMYVRDMKTEMYLGDFGEASRGELGVPPY